MPFGQSVLAAALLLLLALASCTSPGQLPTLAAVAATVPPPTLTASPKPATQTLLPPPAPAPTSSAAPCASPGRIETGVFSSAVAGPSAYRIYLPPCYGLDGRVYPILYMLPGNIHDESIWDELGLDEAAEEAILSGQVPPFLIVMPDGGWIATNTSGGPGSYEVVIIDELIPAIEASFCAWVDRQGRAIGGLSRGGYWALEIAFRHLDRFSSVGGHSAALLDIAAGPDLNPQFTGLSSDLGDLRIYFDIGRDDYAIHNIRQLHEEMVAAVIPHSWVLNEGGHSEEYWAAHVGEYVAWYAAAWDANREHYPDCP